MAETPDHFQWVASIDDIRRNIVEFNRDMDFHRKRAKKACGGTWYWVYDPDSGIFGPSKFVGFRGMTFRQYSKAVRIGTRGAKFNGNKARTRIEAAVEESFHKDAKIEAKLELWMRKRFGDDAIVGWAPSKWYFLALKPSKSEAGSAAENAGDKATCNEMRGQGYGLSKPEIDAIDKRAMAVATAHMVDLKYAVKDCSKGNSYDLYCTRGEEKLFVEVKGTTGDGNSFFISKNEVNLSKDHPEEMALIFVRNIVLHKGTPPHATGGTLVIRKPWNAGDTENVELTGLQFECRLLDLQ